jgi:hypothetical protein
MKSIWLSSSLLVICLFSVGACSAAKTSTDNTAKTDAETTSGGAGGSAKMDIDQSIRKVDFKNFTYEPYCAGDETEKVTVKNSEFSKETKQEEYTDHFWFKVEPASYGDLNGDNSEEAVIVSFCNTGGTGDFSEGFVFTMKGGKPTLLSRFEGGDRAYGGLRSAKVENGLLVVDRNDVGEAGGACCPEFSVTTKYKWTGKELEKSGAEARKALYPEEPVKFAKGATKAVIKVTVDDIKRYSLGARAGQTLTVTSDSSNVTVSLNQGEADVTDGTNIITAKLKESGNFVVQVQNIAEKPTPVTLTFEIR